MEKLNSHQPQNTFEVIIIGAGISGLSAANYLKNKNYHKSLKILESRDRVGGRIYTVPQENDQKVDLGASWIHGIGPGTYPQTDKWRNKLNPIYELSKKFGIKTSKCYDDIEESDEKYFWHRTSQQEIQDIQSQDGQKVICEIQGGEMPLETQQIAEKMRQYYRKMQYRTKENKCLKELFDKSGDQLDLGQFRGDKQMQKFFLSYIWEKEFAADSDQISAYYMEDQEDFDGSDNIFPQGFSQIPETLAQGLDIDFKQKVLSIDYQDSQKIKIVTQFTDDQVLTNQTYFCQKLIVTVTLTILQKQLIDFTPQLPDRKRQAINNLGIGIMDKLILQFDHLFWEKDKNIDWLNFCSDSEFDSQSGYWSCILNHYKYIQNEEGQKGKFILILFNVGREALSYSTQTDEFIIESALQALNYMYFPKKTIISNTDEIIANSKTQDSQNFKLTRQNIIDYSRSNWSQDDHAQISYTFMKVGSKPQACKEIAKGIDKRIWFAGKHTYYEFLGTTHGAYISGEIAAKNVISNFRS
eukprot:403360925